MTCGWSPRHASSRPRRVLSAVWLVPGLLLVCLGAGAAAEPVPTTATGAGPSPEVRLASGAEPCPGCGDLVAADRLWLAGRPGATFGCGSWPDEGDLAPDSLLARLEILRDHLGAVTGVLGADAARSPASLLRDRWLERGYLEVTVGCRPGPVTGPDTLVVTPGRRWRLDGITVEGPDFPGRRELLAAWLPGPGNFRAGTLNEAVTGLLTALGDRGHPFPRWVVRRITMDPDTATLHLTAALLPGPGAVIGPITSDLPPGPGRDFLVRASGLRRGAPFTQRDLELATGRLTARGLYARVDPPRVYLTGSPDTVGIHFPVEPRRKVNRLQVALGLSRDNPDEPGRVSGQVDLELPNMAGTGRALQAGWRDDGAGQSHMLFRYREPLAFGTPLDMATGLESEVRRDVFNRFQLDTSWDLPVVALWGVGAELGWERSTYPQGELERNSRWKVGGSVLHRRADPLRSGWSGRFGITSAWGSTLLRPAGSDSTGGAELGTSESVRIYAVDMVGEIRLTATVALAARAAYRQQGGRDDVVPLAEQFWFGGATTLRGYNEKEFHGSRAAWGGVELRLGRVRGSRVYTFWDLGYFEFRSTDPGDPDRTVKSSGRPWGYGLGILARTRGGDMSLAVGFPGTVDFDLAKLHVALVEAF